MTENRAVSDSKARVSDDCRLQFLSIGHFTHDVVGDDLILGGAAAYSSSTAKKLGLRVGVVTAVGSDFLHYDKLSGISIVAINSSSDKANHPTTTFQNLYENGVRKQFIRGVAAKICAEHIPEDWCNANIVYLCPVANEIEPSVIGKIPNSVIGASPQGWMRRWDSDGSVYAQRWEDAKDILPHIDVLVMSEEDIAPFPDVIDEYAVLAKMTVLTKGAHGSRLFYEGKVTDFPAFRVKVFDPTGAGDVFATAFLYKYSQTKDPHEASRFANCAASFIVEKEGTTGIPKLQQINERLKLYSS